MEFTIKYSKTYRYESLNHASPAKTVLYVLHGYGHLAHYFIKKFESLGKEILIVAPEGMHRFYLNGASGRVGASWMTKEAREMDIKDNVEWLNALDGEISEKYNIENRILLGFSQGGATAARWKLDNNVKFDSIIMWASTFPPDIHANIGELWRNDDKHFVIGKYDEWCSGEDQIKFIESYKRLGFEISTYLGKHEIDDKTLSEIIERIMIKL